MKACLRGALFAVLVLLLSGASTADAQSDLEHKVKAAFLFNFLKFVTWPTEREPAEGQPYVLCVLGDERFSRTLGQAIQDKAVSGHGVEVRYLEKGAALAPCHLVYVAPGLSAPDVETVFGASSDDAVLTVHEAEAAVPSGVIRFFLEAQRVRFEINTAAAERRRLQLSSRLMGVAERVQVTGP